VLFINKVDRLIIELHLSEEQIQKKLDSIISSFNDLIELYCEEPFKNQWKIAASLGNVAFWRSPAWLGLHNGHGKTKTHKILRHSPILR